MGIYVFDTKFLIEELRRDAADPNSAHDFGRDLIPYLVSNGKAVAHHFARSCVRSPRIICGSGRPQRGPSLPGDR